MSLQEAMAEERKRLDKEIKKLDAQKSELDGKIAGLKKELRAIEAYEKAKSGGSSSGGKRRTGIRQLVHDLIKKADGISRADILAKLEAKGDKSAEQSVSNALGALKKQGHVTSENGVYKGAK